MMASISLHVRRGVRVSGFLFGGLFFFFGTGILALVFFNFAPMLHGQIWLAYLMPTFLLMIGLCCLCSGAALIYAMLPGATALFLDWSGFTYRYAWRTSRYEWHEVFRVQANDVRYKTGNGVSVYLKSSPHRRAFLLNDVFDPGRIELSKKMTSFLVAAKVPLVRS